MATDVQIDEKIKIEQKEPSKYKVVLLNDDFTPMDWVIDVLTKIYKYNISTAKQLMLSIHNEGSAVAGIYSYEVAEQKLTETITASRNAGFPLDAKMEEE
jgi:ATP-dependent Clp protease adaptor protein ClpS